MKKIISIILSIAVLMIISGVVYAREWAFHDGVYRGEKWELDFGHPKQESPMVILPQDRPEPKVYGNGYVGRAEEIEKPYDIILLEQ